MVGPGHAPPIVFAKAAGGSGPGCLGGTDGLLWTGGPPGSGARHVVFLARLGIELFDHATAPEFSVRPVPVAVAIAAHRRELPVRDVVDHLGAGHDLDGERQGRLPARPGTLTGF